METIKDILQYMSKSGDWSYYKDPPPIPEEVLTCGEQALQFIQNHFQIGGKEKVFSFPQIKCQNGQSVLKKQRAIHIVSTFLLGLRIATNCLGVNIVRRDDKGMSFQYKWFLTCLYHDIGYVYESLSDCEQIKKIASDGLEAVRSVCGITKLLDINFFKSYPREIVDLYLKKRAECHDGKCGVIDHGIIGGLLLYDGLRRMFEESWKKRLNKDQATQDDFDVRNGDRILHCSNKHFETYAEAADAIIMHNIWNKTLEQYLREENLSDYVLANHSISYSNNLLCFILCLADTIEPLKRNPQYADSIDFSFDKRLLKILSKEQIIKQVYDNIEECKEWLPVNVKKHKDEVTIEIIM